MVARLVALASFISTALARDLLEEAEDAAAVRVKIGADASTDEAFIAWAENMQELRLGEDGVEDEVLPQIAVGADEATLMEAPSAQGIAVLGRKQLAGRLKVDVLENQLVVVHNMESADDRKKRLAAGIESAANVYASELACLPLNGTVFFLLAHRRPLDGAGHVHELAFFSRELWGSFTEYMRRARQEWPAVLDGSWRLKVHWNVLPLEQRVPFELSSSGSVRVAATPKIRQPLS